MIRSYTSKDTEALLAIWEKANAAAHPFLPPEFTDFVRTSVREVFLPQAQTWVLEEMQRPIGFIAMIDTEIGGLFLDPTCHGQGHGRAMVDHVVSLKGPLRVEVFKDNKIGLPFYLRYGFEIIGEYHHAESGFTILQMAMPGADPA
ncbi:GNAT family N-acetyltransferase [Pseudophaeobacter sp.]|uniref:GNAT family N-acetyltransferase n=1 Tax=Pseudophaeobacter sp. TaxID=1971739 RepID=UPI003296B813